MDDPQNQVSETFTTVYEKLRALASARLRRSRRHTLLDTTSLVHDFYVRAADSGAGNGSDWSQCVQYASRVMRNIVVDSVRRRYAARHGGCAERVEFIDELPAPAVRAEQEILLVHGALDRLATVDSRLAHIVEMRYFAGMTEAETAGALGLTERTVRREWQKARILLAQAMA